MIEWYSDKDLIIEFDCIPSVSMRVLRLIWVRFFQLSGFTKILHHPDLRFGVPAKGHILIEILTTYKRLLF